MAKLSSFWCRLLLFLALLCGWQAKVCHRVLSSQHALCLRKSRNCRELRKAYARSSFSQLLLQSLCGNRRRKESSSHRTIRFDDEFHQGIYHRQPSRQGGESRELPFQEWRHGEGDRWRIQGSRRQGGKSIRPAEGCGRSRRSLPHQYRLYS